MLTENNSSLTTGFTGSWMQLFNKFVCFEPAHLSKLISFGSGFSDLQMKSSHKRKAQARGAGGDVLKASRALHANRAFSPFITVLIFFIAAQSGYHCILQGNQQEILF